MESILAAKETLIQLNSWLKCIKKDVDLLSSEQHRKLLKNSLQVHFSGALKADTMI